MSRILGEFQQTYKLTMYTRLAYTIGVFVAAFAVVSMLVMMGERHWINWPWQVAWLQEVLWESLNFAVICATCIICLPTGIYSVYKFHICLCLYVLFAFRKQQDVVICGAVTYGRPRR